MNLPSPYIGVYCSTMKEAAKALTARVYYALRSVSPGTVAVALALGAGAFLILSLYTLATQAGIVN